MKIITALTNPVINNKLKKIKNFEIMCNDIQYQEGIIEILEKNNGIELAIISELLPGTLKIEELVNQIRLINNKIDIIVILNEKNEKTKNNLISFGIVDIYYNNEISIDELIKIIQKKDDIQKEDEINKEIKNLKKIILENSNIIKNDKAKKNKIKTKLKKYLLKTKKTAIQKENMQYTKKVISFSGANGSGKSIVASIFIKLIENKKIILIDFDFFNESINTNFGVKKQINPNGSNDLSNLIIKINKRIDLLCGTQLLFNDNFKIKEDEIKSVLTKLSKEYDLIFIDTSSECFFDYTKEILRNSDLIVFLSEANLLQLKKSKRLLEIYVNKWRIEKSKINILFNKININSIDNRILKVLFSDFNILGELQLNKNYDLLINNNLGNINIDLNIKKEFQKIIKKII